MMVELLRVADLTVSYFTDQLKIVALDNVSLSIDSGEIVGLVGESGSGKSTLANTVMRTVKPPARIMGGQIFFHGKDILQMSDEDFREIRWRGISVVPQASQNALSPTMRVLDHFADTMKAHGVTDGQKIKETAGSYLREVLLEPNRILSAYPHELSGGMKQRVLIALSLVLNPSLVIFDEPTSALDVVTQQGILELIKELHHKTGFSILFITHDISLFAGFTEKVGVMYYGKMMEYGPTKEVLNSPVNPYTISLLRAIPPLHGDVEAVRSIPGNPPSSRENVSGCRFNPRCAYVQEVCRAREPGLEQSGQAHFSACHFNGELKAASAN